MKSGSGDFRVRLDCDTTEQNISADESNGQSVNEKVMTKWWDMRKVRMGGVDDECNGCT